MTMQRLLHKLWAALLAICLLTTACNDEPSPTSLIPIVEIAEAEDITRTAATLSGQVTIQGNGEVTQLRFRYGTTEAMELSAACDATTLQPMVRLQELTPNTTYFYCLEAGNGYSSRQSSTGQFTTAPNRTPILGQLVLLNQGPLSITLQCEVPDDGGEAITAAGFYFRSKNGEEQRQDVHPVPGKLLRGRISNLQPSTTYTVQAFAANAMGETRSEDYTFHTDQALVVTSPGTLAETMGADEKYTFETLRISGPLNGTDFRFIRDLLGRNIDGETTPGRLKSLDLTDATVHSGGMSFDGSHFTSDHTISIGLFAYCTQLSELQLPATTRIIEEDAFAHCTALTTLQVPMNTQQVVPSDHCPQLQAIEVIAGNTRFSAHHGVLYNADGSALIWYPEGKTEAVEWPDKLQSIEAYAMRNLAMQHLVLPAGIKEITRGAFYAAHIESVVLPDGVEYIAAGLFQACRQLKVVTLGSRVNSLGDYCFNDCPLQHLYMQTRDMPPVCTPHTFEPYQYESCTLHVPQENAAQYRNSPYWKAFRHMVTEP